MSALDDDPASAWHGSSRLYHTHCSARIDLAIQIEAADVIKILIVDDQATVRKGLRMRLEAESDLLVVGEAADGETALFLAKALAPDVVLMDVKMPRMDGIEATEALRIACPHAAVIMLSIYDDAQTRARAENAGAKAFVPKSVPTDMLRATIRQITGV
jgi:two-component system NarL family response regulator